MSILAHSLNDRGQRHGLTRRGSGSLVGLGLILLSLLVVSCSTPAGSPVKSPATPALGASPSLAAVVTPAPPSIPSATPTPTAVPPATPTPIPTATPLPPITVKQLEAACNGTPVPGAAPYAGTIHPLVVLWQDGAGGWIVDGFSTQFSFSYTYAINNKWFRGSWDGPIQLVVCPNNVQSQKLSSCGNYTRDDGVVGEVIPYRDFVTVKVIVARTGKLLQSKTFWGGAPACTNQVQLPATDNPPWKISGDPIDTQSGGPVDLYATTVSTQKVK